MKKMTTLALGYSHTKYSKLSSSRNRDSRRDGYVNRVDRCQWCLRFLRQSFSNVLNSSSHQSSLDLPLCLAQLDNSQKLFKTFPNNLNCIGVNHGWLSVSQRLRLSNGVDLSFIPD